MAIRPHARTAAALLVRPGRGRLDPRVLLDRFMEGDGGPVLIGIPAAAARGIAELRSGSRAAIDAYVAVGDDVFRGRLRTVRAPEPGSGGAPLGIDAELLMPADEDCVAYAEVGNLVPASRADILPYRVAGAGIPASRSRRSAALLALRGEPGGTEFRVTARRPDGATRLIGTFRAAGPGEAEYLAVHFAEADGTIYEDRFAEPEDMDERRVKLCAERVPR